VEKVSKDSLTVVPRGPGGKALRPLTLRLLATSRVSLVVARREGVKVLLTQRESAAEDLKPGQGIAVIYTTAGSDEKPILLSAVAQPAPAR
jgi:hypothetical protein